MKQRFSIWAILAFGLIMLSTFIGWGLNAVIAPRVPNYNRIWGMAPVRPVPPPPPTPVVLRTFTAFRPPVKPTVLEANEFINVLDTIARAASNRVANSLPIAFDTRRMAEEEIPLGLYALFDQQPGPAILDAAANEIQADLSTLAEKRPETFPPGTVEIRQVMWSENRNEVLVLARHSDAREGVRWTRWWMNRRAGEWKVYDFDFPDSRLRFLTVRNYLLQAPVRDHVGAGPNRNADPNAPDLIMFSRYQSAFEWINLASDVDDPAGINATIWFEPIESVPMIPYVQAAEYVLRARQWALRGDAEQVRRALNAIPANMATAAHVRFAKVIRANAEKKPAEAIEAIREYRNFVGDDPIAYREEAKAKAALAGPAEAIAVLRNGLKVFPGNIPIAMDLALRLPAADRASLGEELAKTTRPESLATAAQLFERRHPAVLDELCSGWLKISPDDPFILSIAVPAKVAVGQSKAASLLMKRTADPTRRGIALELIRRAVFAPDPTEIFHVLTDADMGRYAFRGLAKSLVMSILMGSLPEKERTKRIASLRALATAHRAVEPNDPFLHYAEGAIWAANGERTKADAEFVAGLVKYPEQRTERRPLAESIQQNGNDREAIRYLRVDQLARNNNWKLAYETTTPAVDTFDQLANYLSAARDERALTSLVELHAKSHAQDIELIAWRGEVAYLTKDYETAIRYFRDYRDKSGKENRHILRIDERLIRSLIRLKRPDEAAAALEESAEPIRNGQLFRVMVAAAQGKADAVLVQFDSTGLFQPMIWYADPDLGPILQSPAFERVRQKYPPPVR